MRIFLIGHRGTGKTSLLQRYQIYSHGALAAFDLDREIEKRTGRTVHDLFTHDGEVSFRKLEKQTLDALIAENLKMVCALGAGFEVSQYAFPESSELVWVRRGSDAAGRIFLNRPRLNAQVSPLQEYRDRFVTRDSVFAAQADWVYLLPEGLSGPDQVERHILGERMPAIGGSLTLRPDHFRHPRVFANRFAKMGVDYFELRSDLLNANELSHALAILPLPRTLISVRQLPLTPEWSRAQESAVEVDWPLELGQKPEGKATIISLHEARGDEDLMAMTRRLEEFETQGLHVKLSPLVETFSDIDRGLQWQSEKPKQRSFLPRSKSGRWSWVRLLLKGRQKINFFRDGDGSALDQPTLHEWMRATNDATHFATLLGSPVDHSYSPVEHMVYAQEKRIRFLAVEVSEAEWSEALPILEKWGMQWAAVTSPLKHLAFEFGRERSPEAIEMHTANTLTKKPDGTWRAHNTDLAGFAEMMLSVPDPGNTVIWGGGGTLPVIHKVLPAAQPVSVRSGKPRDPSQDLLADPETLIWAAGPQAEAPVGNWKPSRIIDLNYREDSRAREYAQSVGASYISGLLMFRAQASAQRDEWDRHGR